MVIFAFIIIMIALLAGGFKILYAIGYLVYDKCTGYTISFMKGLTVEFNYELYKVLDVGANDTLTLQKINNPLIVLTKIPLTAVRTVTDLEEEEDEEDWV